MYGDSFSLGMGLKEMNYKDAMEIEFNEQEIPYEREVKFDVLYKGFQLPIHILLILFCLIPLS